jgi:hypothetical protein
MTLPRGGWFISEAPTPNWDLVVACDFVGKPGLALIEAKAHEGELGWAGKRPPKRSVNSVANHDRIGLAIGEACSCSRSRTGRRSEQGAGGAVQDHGTGVMVRFRHGVSGPNHDRARQAWWQALHPRVAHHGL